MCVCVREKIQLALISSVEQASLRGALCLTEWLKSSPCRRKMCNAAKDGRDEVFKQRECRNLGHHFHLTHLALNKGNNVSLSPLLWFFFLFSFLIFQSEAVSRPVHGMERSWMQGKEGSSLRSHLTGRLGEDLVILAERHQEHDGRHFLKAVDPFPPLRTLATHIHHPAAANLNRMV